MEQKDKRQFKHIINNLKQHVKKVELLKRLQNELRICSAEMKDVVICASK